MCPIGDRIAFSYKNHEHLCCTPKAKLSNFVLAQRLLTAVFLCAGTYGTSDFFDWRMGLATPWSHVPHNILDFNDQMTFAQRLYNVVLSVFDAAVVRPFIFMPRQTAVAEKHFADSAPLPSLSSLNKNISLTLVYAHRSISDPRPAMPGLINIGGAHIKPTQPLPGDIQAFLDGASHGAIFFSLGTFLKSTSMSDLHLTAFLSKNSAKLSSRGILMIFLFLQIVSSALGSG